MKKRNIILTVTALLVIVGAFGFYKFSEKTEKSIAEAADITLTAETLINAYKSDAQKADRLYLGKIVQVEGKLLQVIEVQNGVNLEISNGNEFETVTATIDQSVLETMPTAGQLITVKGKCDGYVMEEMLGISNVNLSQASIIK